jgi:hypothetical protein
MGVLDAFVRAGRHHAPKASFGSCALGVHVDDALHLWMVEKEAVDWSVAASYERLREAADVQALDTLFAIVATAQEFDAGIRVVRVELRDLYGLAEYSHFCADISPPYTGTYLGSSHTCTEAFARLPGLRCGLLAQHSASAESGASTTQPSDLLLQLRNHLLQLFDFTAHLVDMYNLVLILGERTLLTEASKISESYNLVNANTPCDLSLQPGNAHANVEQLPQLHE